jgi:hypothetical protein
LEEIRWYEIYVENAFGEIIWRRLNGTRRFYFNSFYYNTLVAPCLSSLIAKENCLNIEVGITRVLDERRQCFTGKVIVKRVVVLKLGCCHYGGYRWHRFWIGFWIEKLKSTMASREFGEEGLCFKGGRSATVRLGLGYVVRLPY